MFKLFYIGIPTCLLASGCVTSSPTSSVAPVPLAAVETRQFHFEYATQLSGYAPEARTVRVWLPLPQNDEAQAISNLKIEAPVPYKETRDPLYDNRMAFIELAGPLPSMVPLKVSYDVVRRETKGFHSVGGSQVRPRALQADKLTAIDGEVARRAVVATVGKEGRTEIGRALYDKVLADVNYDKSGKGWGRGDTSHVCEVGKGNCSDFHALFIGMARSQQIPALFEIGFPLPQDKNEGMVGGYHCWAWFEETANWWKPVDASEADKDPSRTDYFYGTLCCNRVALTRGRDILLEPSQAGPPLNFFIYPYVEVDGKSDAAKVENTFKFRDIGASATRKT